MEIILLERIEKLGQIGDVVTVKDGYARNFLLPRKKALRASEANKKYFEGQRKQIEAHNRELMDEAKKLAGKVEKAKIVILRQAGDTGQLYGSVTSRDISHELEGQGFEITSDKVILDKPIKEIGLVEVSLHLHPEVWVKLPVNVARSPEEAQSQEKAHEKALQVFESEELAKAAEEKLAGKQPGAEAEKTAEQAEGEEKAAKAPEAGGKAPEKPAKGKKKVAKEPEKAERKAAPAKAEKPEEQPKAAKKKAAKKSK